MNKKRLDWIDMAKGFGILMVMLGHINWGIPNKLVYSCHLPLFFFLSGYVFSRKDSFKTFGKQKVKTILLPHFLLAIPLLYFIPMYETSYSFKQLPEIILRFILQIRMSTLWYLGCLFVVSFFFYWILSKAKKTLTRWITIGILAVIGLLYARFHGPWLPWNIDTALTALPFFGLGYEFKLHQEGFSAWYDVKKKGFKIGMAILLFFINMLTNGLTWLIARNGLEMYWSHYGFEPFTYISAVSGIAFVIVISKAVTWRPIRYIGRNSLIYFAWHQAIPIAIYEHMAERHFFVVNLYKAGVPRWACEPLKELIEYIVVLIFMTIVVMCFNLIKNQLFKKRRSDLHTA